MDDAKRELVQGWLIKARHDLAAARKLAADPDPYWDTAIYHCQQAAEKAVKGFLVFHDQRFEKTHDIQLLITLAAPLEAGFASWLDAAERLTPYAAAFRYPGEVMEPDREEFDQALQAAAGLYAFVLSLLPEEVHP
jgi:HEPN domain-containing protein